MLTLASDPVLKLKVKNQEFFFCSKTFFVFFQSAVFYGFLKNETRLYAYEETVERPYVTTDTAAQPKPNFIFSLSNALHYNNGQGFFIKTSSGKFLTTTEENPEIDFLEYDCIYLEGNDACDLAVWELEMEDDMYMLSLKWLSKT